MWPVLIAACEAAQDWRRALELALVRLCEHAMAWCVPEDAVGAGLSVLRCGSL